MLGRKEGERRFATNLRSYKVNHFPVGSGFPGRGRGVGQGRVGFHLSLPGLVLPPAAASQPRAFPPPPDHIWLRSAEPQSPPKELGSQGTNPGAPLLVCVSVSLSASSAAVRRTPLLPAPFPPTRERIPAGGGGAEQGIGCRREAVPDPRAALPPAQGLPRGLGPPASRLLQPTLGYPSPPPSPAKARTPLAARAEKLGGLTRRAIAEVAPPRTNLVSPTLAHRPDTRGSGTGADFPRTSQPQHPSPGSRCFPP